MVRKNAQSTPKTKYSSLLTLFDVALALGISIATARRYALSGLLPSVRIAGRIRVPREAVAKAQREGVGKEKTRQSRRAMQTLAV